MKSLEWLHTKTKAESNTRPSREAGVAQMTEHLTSTVKDSGL